MDIALRPDYFGEGLVELENGDLVTDGGLETSVYISLFTDARENGENGFWADTAMGSRLWTLKREKMLKDIVVKTKDYCKEALQWLVDDGVVGEISIDVSRSGSMIFIEIGIQKPDISFKYEYNWVEQQARPLHAR